MFNFENEDIQAPFYNNIQIGVVENNVDPTNAGRVQVRIIGLHSTNRLDSNTDGIPVEKLPWAIPANPIQGGSISGLGWSGVPVQGSHVCLFFIGGDHNFPVYFASIAGIYQTQPDKTKGFSDPTGKYPEEIGVPDFNSEASPTNTVFETPDNGVRVQYDSTPGSEKYNVTLKNTLTPESTLTEDTNIQMDSTGTTITSNGNVTIIAGATSKIMLQVGNTLLTALDGVLTGQSVDPFTGNLFAEATNVSQVVQAATV
jgi:hypothetical protein